MTLLPFLGAIVLSDRQCWFSILIQLQHLSISECLNVVIHDTQNTSKQLCLLVMTCEIHLSQVLWKPFRSKQPFLRS